jgi:DNA-binding NtrC family response regulator
MRSRFAYVEAIAPNSNPVLITGESGVGKELVARAIHRLSGRQGGFVSENIAGLDDTMVADTLFGHARGAFTDAEASRKGLVEEAGEGTLFLDEIGDLSMGSQVKLLRFLEEKEYRPLGSDGVRVSDARIIIATNVDIEKKLHEGAFREDLYYRLTHRIDIPPLRERLEDLPLLVDHFVESGSRALGREKPLVPEELVTLLQTYSFPGNVRELKNLIDNALSRDTSRVLSLSFFRDSIRGNGGRGAATNLDFRLESKQITFGGEFPTLKEVEGFFIADALRKAGGNQSTAARLLGLSASALSRRLRKAGAGGNAGDHA